MSSRKRNADALGAAASAAAASAAASSPALPAFHESLAPSRPPRTPTLADPQGFTRIGQVVRVKMIDFMIYAAEEMFPGPGLNLLVGPNGSGKSTCVSAIGLALAGETKSVGRFEHLGEYVKRGQPKALVEVELFGGGPHDRNLIVTRTFSADDKRADKFAINGETAKKADVAKQMAALNIQVNNLCVYLAQFNVGQFAEMNAESMLTETEKAADLKLYTKHMLMKQQAADAKKNEESIAQSQKVYDALKLEVQSMEGERKVQEEREANEQKIEDLEARKKWAAHEALMVQVDRAKEVVAKCDKDAKTELERQGPIRDALKAQKELFASSLLTYNQLSAREHECRRIRLERASQIETQEAKIEAAENQLNDLEMTAARRQHELTKEKSTLANLQKSYDALKAGQPHASELEAQEAALANDRERKKHRLALMEYRQKMAEKSSAKTTAGADLTIAQQHLSTLKATPVDSAKTRLVRLDRATTRGTIDKDEQIIRRLRSEGKLKDHMHVWGPLLAEITVRDADPAVAAQVAVYVENVIPKKWTTAWIVDDKLAFDALHEAHIQGTVVRVDKGAHEVKRPYDIHSEKFRGMGLAWLDQSVQCAPEVMRALHDALGFHNHVFARASLRPDQCEKVISRQKQDGGLYSLLSPHHKYSTSTVQWTDTISVQVSDMARVSKVLGGGGVDASHAAALAKAEAEVSSARQSLSDAESDLQSTQRAWESGAAVRLAQLAELEQQANKLIALQHEHKKFNTAIANSNNKIRELEKHVDNTRDKRALLDQIFKIEKLRESLSAELYDHVQSAADSRALQSARAQSLTSKQVVEHLTIQVNTMSARAQQLESARQEAKVRLVSARKAADHQAQLASQGKPKAALDALDWMQALRMPDGTLGVDVLDAKIFEIRNAIARVVVDESIRKRYEDKSKELAIAEQQLNLSTSNLSDLQKSIQESEKTWLASVESKIHTINEHFARYFSYIGCRGSVTLQREPTFGIVISVSFRKGEEPRPLSGASQSGGEKSVSTMLFLLCLQEVTNTPFRMADEINQGMDANNERLVFNQIVRSCNQQRKDAQGNVVEPTQYFVVTPKLLPELEYSSRVRIFQIYNGPGMLSQQQWDLDRFLRIPRMHEYAEAMRHKKQRVEKQRRAAIGLQSQDMSLSQSA